MPYPYTDDALGLFEPDPPTTSCSACGDEVETAIAYVLGGICEECEKKATANSAVVECVSALSAMSADPSHFREGPVTAGAVYIRLATKHGIDTVDLGVKVIQAAADAGLIDIQWMDGKRMVSYSASVLTLSHTEVA